MTTQGQNIEFDSKDIGKKPTEELIKNTYEESRAKKFFAVPDNVKFLISIILAIATVAALVVMIVVVVINNRDSSGYPEEYEQEVSELEDRANELILSSSGEDLDELLGEIAYRLEIARSTGDWDMVYRLYLAEADALIGVGLTGMALTDILVPLLDDNEDNDNRRYDIYSRILAIYQHTGDVDGQLDFLQRIITLPDSAFPRTTDDTWRSHFENLLRELQ